MDCMSGEEKNFLENNVCKYIFNPSAVKRALKGEKEDICKLI